MVGRDIALFILVVTTGTVLGPTAAPGTEPTDKASKTDDFAGVAGAYGPNGVPGISVAGSPLDGLGIDRKGSSIGGGPYGPGA